MICAPIYYEPMTPEQEQRLGEMMFAEARSAGRVNKAPRDADNEKIARREKLDDVVKNHIFLFLKNNKNRPLGEVALLDGEKNSTKELKVPLFLCV